MRRFASVFVPKRDSKRPQNSSSSSSSSTGSTSLFPQTPEDEHPPRILPRWKSWIGVKKLPAPKSHTPVTPVQFNHVDEDDDEDEEEDEDGDDDDDDDEDDSLDPDLPSAVERFETHTRNGLQRRSLGPFVQCSSDVLFPRSINPPSTPNSSGLRVHLFKSRLLNRLPHLDAAQRSAIAPFAANPTRHPHLSDTDILYPSKSTFILNSSPGLRRWISRPPFEERYLLYLPSSLGLQIKPISSSMPIAALEYSVALDVMVDPDFDLSPKPASPLSHAPLPEPAPTTAIQSRNSYTSVPSPLRNERPPSPTEKPVKNTVKRVVRFVEEDDDDGLPLHLVRMKKKREEKALFLRQEQIKRETEEREELKRQEKEAMERERKRLAKEKERKEREAALYAETVASARQRREQHRAKGLPHPSNINDITNKLLTPSSSFSSLRDSERNRAPHESKRYPVRLPHDPPAALTIPRREASDPALHINPHYYSDSPSPGSSRPPSLAHSPTGIGFNSRPPSTYSSSSEDVRQQLGGSRRNSAMTAASLNLRPPMIMSYPTWAGSNPHLQYMPPVPMVPDFAQDMPLLPPTAPFMKSYDRRSSRNSVSPGPPSTSSSRRGSVSSATDKGIPIPMNPRTSSYSSAPSPSSSPRSSWKPTHERRSSGESGHTSKSKSSTVPTGTKSYTLPRGRPSLPQTSSSQYLQLPSPWTALPSQNGLVPHAMPNSSYSHNNYGVSASGTPGGTGRQALIS